MFVTYRICFILLAIIGGSQASIAERAVQIHNPRAVYQGGWPLALSASNKTCPSSAPVKCDNGNVNPSCCPSDQSCFWSPALFAFSCCPTAASCEVAVRNFPRCAITSWNMFVQGSSYFCCEPGAVAVNPKSGLSDGLCEPADQPIPQSLLATMASQVGAATSTPNASNATQIAGPTQTNPSLPSKSSNTGEDLSKTISHWSLGTKIGVGIAVFVAFVGLLVVSSILRRRRNRGLGYRYATGFNEYDEDGNLVLREGYRAGYEPYRRYNEGGVNNNLTVNVVRGDQTS